MEVSRYGIRMRRLMPDQLETVRQWRNKDRVRLSMEKQELISEKQQLEWYNSLDLETNFFFVADFEGQPAALLHIKEVDWLAASGESGIFVGEESFLNSSYPLLAVLALNDLAFFLFGLKTLYAKIANSEAYNRQFNEALGFISSPKPCSPAFQYYALKCDAYLAKAGKFRNTAGKAYGWKTQLQGISNDVQIEKLLGQLSDENRQMLQIESR